MVSGYFRLSPSLAVQSSPNYKFPIPNSFLLLPFSFHLLPFSPPLEQYLAYMYVNMKRV
jgi:hypothetical protein